MKFGKGNRVFGQAMSKRTTTGSATRYQRQHGTQSSNAPAVEDPDTIARDEAAARRRVRHEQGEAIDLQFGYERLEDQPVDPNLPLVQRRGWLFHMLPTTRVDQSSGIEQAGLDLYFVDQDGENFKTTLLHRPYFYLLTRQHDENLGQLLLRKFAGTLLDAQIVPMVDLDMPNHLSPDNLTRKVWKLLFDNVSQLMDVRSQLLDMIKTATAQHDGMSVDNLLSSHNQFSASGGFSSVADSWSNLEELREYDVPYNVRVCMDLDIRAGTWYTVSLEYQEAGPPIPHLSDPDMETKGTPRVLAFDIECSKAPLKFPNPDIDEIYMISYMVSDGNDNAQGFLITSRSIVSEDIPDFDYTPKPSYPGPFRIFNEQDEKTSIERFVEEFQKHRPQIVVTYNGDNFDWPFMMARAKYHGIDLWKELGISPTGEDEIRGRCCVHLDCFAWVQRDSYLPQGAQGLKAVTKYKLGYEPVDVDAEDMLPMAKERPLDMAKYSVSDAVATYYLYDKYVHLFIFSLCTLIPMGPEDVLRKGSGTLCEALLMVQANHLEIICPNKQVDPLAKFHKGHLLESETYIGGKVECLETGVYRSDIEYDFDLNPTAFQTLIDNVDRDLSFAIEVESGIDRSEIVNYEEVRTKIVEQLELLRDRPKRKERPYVYHLDVGAMYPNIILTNRLQPSAIVDDAVCAACDFNQAKNDCKRRMEWVWRGDYSPAGKQEYERTKDQLQRETPKEGPSFKDLSEKKQATMIASRLKQYSRNAFRKTKITEEVTRQDIVCMRENDFYVETVRRFRDRRYDYKKMTKTWKKKIDTAPDAASRKLAEDKTLVYDSLQVAHKCILNSFYGYVMRKGARWRSMEMAGIVTKTGADLITQARKLVEQIGRPLELDTDGIWCILPGSFPDVYTFKTHDGSQVKLEYPCVMLNADVHDNFTNHQYQTLKDPARGIYESRSECSIFFEVDGPYRCMVIPASTEEGKLLKKRYAVFNFDGSLAELKGFELKRRGELELVKRFQSQVFDRFLDGTSLAECYDSVANIANRWLDVIDTRGKLLSDQELFDLISENRSMSRQLDDYGEQKGTSQTTARRLGEFLGAEIIKDKGLNCKFIIAEQPYGAPVTERAIPTSIWQAEPEVKKHFLRKWLKSPGLDGDGFDLRNILDWNYYSDRLGKTIQKIITIPAALQKVDNPVPRVPHPDWLENKVTELNNRFQQKSITQMFAARPIGWKKATEKKAIEPMDIEDFGGTPNHGQKQPTVHFIPKKRGNKPQTSEEIKRPEDPVERVELNKENFATWLTQKKSSWRELRKQRRGLSNGTGRDGVGSKSDQLQKKSMGSMEGFMKEAAQNLTQREWQVLEIREMTSADIGKNDTKQSSGEFVAWIMLGKDSLRKVQISVPRIVYVSSRQPIRSSSPEIEIRKVDKHLPHGKSANHLYEVIMSEYVYRNRDWVAFLTQSSGTSDDKVLLEQIYETGTPLLMRALTELGCVSRLKPSASRKQKSYSLSDLKRVDRPTEAPYLHPSLFYRRAFLYVRINPKTKIGIVALFAIDKASGGRGDSETNAIGCDVSSPATGEPGSFDVTASCQLWILKPGALRGQRNISSKQCETIFSQLLQTIHDTADLESEYACVSPQSRFKLSGLNFMDREDKVFASVGEALNTVVKAANCPTLLLLNSNRPVRLLRNRIPSLNNVPVAFLPFPPGPDHSPSMTTLPALNWEQPAVQLCLEAYLYMGVVSFPQRVSYARYGSLPLGNLGEDVDFTLYEVGIARMLQRNRALSWANHLPGVPDLGAALVPSGDGKLRPWMQRNSGQGSSDAWGDEDELVSPVIRKPGCYRTVCVDIDVHDLAVAALTDLSTMTSSTSGLGAESADPGSPTSVLQLGDKEGFDSFKHTEPLGDEMSTSTALLMLRSLVGAWLKDAFTSNNEIADAMLHHLYRLVSNPNTLMHDPALHRVVHSLMKGTFMRLLGELQRLGCTIVFATFHRITIATNKITLGDAEEHVNFVISTVQRQCADSEEQSALARIGLRPRQFHSHFVFLDEYNFGTLTLERREKGEVEDEYCIEEETGETVVIPSVVSAWSIMNYIGSDMAKEYFRIITGRFSREVLKKQIEIQSKDDKEGMMSIFCKELRDELLQYRRKMIGKHFAAYLTRAVAEIVKDFHHQLSQNSNDTNPVLEFIKATMVVLELDQELDTEVHVLKRSLFAQVGIAEYSSLAQWENPCPTFILPDIFCSECRETRDLNLCYVPPSLEDDGSKHKQIHWFCEDCGTEYDTVDIERRLIQHVHRRIMRYQMQDIRCSKTNRVATSFLSRFSACGADFKLDIVPQEASSELRTLRDIARQHELEELLEVTTGVLASFQH